MSLAKNGEINRRKVQPVKTGIKDDPQKENHPNQGSSGKMLSSNGWRNDPNIEYLSTDRMIEYLRSIYMDGIPKIDSWTKSRGQSPTSTAAKTGGISETATPKTRVFEPTDQPNRLEASSTKSESQAKKPYQMPAIGSSQEIMSKKELEQLITRNISLEETVRLMKDRLLQYEQVLVGLHRLSRDIKATHQQLQGGMHDVEGTTGVGAHQSAHSSAREWSSPHIQDTESVNYSKFAELIDFYQDQHIQKKQLGSQCGALDKEIVELEAIINNLKQEIEQLNQTPKTPEPKKTAPTPSNKDAQEAAALRKTVQELTQQQAEWNRERESLLKENDQLVQEDFKLKQLVAELQESAKESQHELERTRLLTTIAPARNLSIPVPAVFATNNNNSPDKQTHGPQQKERVRWEHVREHLTDQVNVYLDLQTKIATTKCFEVRCGDQNDERQPLEVNLLLEVEKILDGLDARLDAER